MERYNKSPITIHKIHVRHIYVQLVILYVQYSPLPDNYNVIRGRSQPRIFQHPSAARTVYKVQYLDFYSIYNGYF